MMQARMDMLRSLWACFAVSAIALPVVGCAGGAWLESPSEAELPLDPPARGYPTAIRSSLSDNSEPRAPAITASAVAAPEQIEAAKTIAQTDQPPAPVISPHVLQRLDRQAPLTPLAVIPPQFVRQPASSPQAPAPIPAPAPMPAPALPAANEMAAAFAPLMQAWSPTTYLPGLDANIAAPMQNPAWPTPQVSAPALPIASGPAAHPIASVSAAVTPAQHQQESPGERQARLDREQSELIEALEAEVRRRRAENASDEDLPRLEQQLRLVYLASGRMDEAVAAVESLDPAQREAYKNLMFGLGVWLSPDEARRLPLRSAKVLYSLRDATEELAAASKLQLKNIAFCEWVEHFGKYAEFARKEFQPKQQVILYVEVDNFAAEHKAPAGYETELNGSYEILDSRGELVASRQLQPDKEICRNYRRDYYLAYKMYLPENIAPGRYRLELTIEDMKARGKYQGRKLGEGVIEFAIR
jgi:hypothetical protein